MSAHEWYQLDSKEVTGRLNSNSEQGLSDAEAANLQARYGPNELIDRGGKAPWRILWEQFSATMVVILMVAAGISALLGQFKDAGAIMAIVVLFALLGFFQEYRAEQAMAALKKLTVPVVKGLRNGQVKELSARALVPGDIILLEAGNIVPADCRLLESVNLRIQEAALTGESEAVDKDPTPIDRPNLPLGDRRNMAFMGTVVNYGRGKAIVTATGMQTELGKIAGMLQNVAHEPTPLQRRLDHVGRTLAKISLVIAGLIFALGWLRGEDLQLMFLTTVSVAVAIIPEGLPAVLTITLALGAQRMLKRQALIRKLPAVETLGSVTVICSDKTGTLTQNQMTVTALEANGQRLELSQTDTPALAVPYQWLLTGGALCNDAILSRDDAGRWQAVGDSTEGALSLAAVRFGLNAHDLQRQWPRVAELPFDSDRKRMTTVHAVTDAPQLSAWAGQAAFVGFTKGSVDGLLPISTHRLTPTGLEQLTDTHRQQIEESNNQLAQKGMRVLGVAMRLFETHPDPLRQHELENDLIFLGLVGMIDPPRPEVKQAVQTCRAAGIRPIMITGDHPLTARQIARQLGIATNETVLTGQNLAQMSADQLRAAVEQVSVYARVSPEHKLKIVGALQERGHIAAMTGDGVNDAPALKKANIGVAMGITGTDVSKEAADMVLRDDNFATIVSAVEEGRVIYENIRKFIKFSVSGNIGKVSVMLVAPLLNMPLPLLPLQLLWLNLLTDGLLGLGLGVEPAEKNTMRRAPRQPGESIFAGKMGWHISWIGLLIGLIAMSIGFGYWYMGRPNWQTMIFTTLALAQTWQALAIRSGQESLFSVGLLSNRLLLGMVMFTLGAQLAVVYAPFLQNFFSTMPMSALDLAISVGAGSLVFIAIELEKLLSQWRAGRAPAGAGKAVSRSSRQTHLTEF